MSREAVGSLAWLLAWRGILNFPAGEFWVSPIGLFEDSVAVYQIMNGAEEAPKKKEINYEDDSVWDLL